MDWSKQETNHIQPKTFNNISEQGGQQNIIKTFGFCFHVQGFIVKICFPTKVLIFNQISSQCNCTGRQKYPDWVGSNLVTNQNIQIM